MGHLYVTELFALLHWLGITQQAVAGHLKIARSTVALWARKTDTRPVPKRHALELVNFVATAAEDALAQGHIYKHDLMDRIERWALERVISTGTLEQDYRRHVQTLQAYLHRSPLKMDATERNAVAAASKGISRTFRLLGFYHQHMDETDDKHLWGDTLESPRKRLMQIAMYTKEEVSAED